MIPGLTKRDVICQVERYVYRVRTTQYRHSETNLTYITAPKKISPLSPPWSYVSLKGFRANALSISEELREGCSLSTIELAGTARRPERDSPSPWPTLDSTNCCSCPQLIVIVVSNARGCIRLITVEQVTGVTITPSRAVGKLVGAAASYSLCTVEVPRS